MVKKTCTNGHKYIGNECPFCPGSNPKGREKARVFGTTIRETVEVFKSVSSSEKSQKISSKERNIILFRIVASLVLAGVAIYFFYSRKTRCQLWIGRFHSRILVKIKIITNRKKKYYGKENMQQRTYLRLGYLW